LSERLDLALRAARALLDVGLPVEEVLGNSAIAPDLAGSVRAALERESSIILEPPLVISSNIAASDWLQSLDRSGWHYWPTLRQFLLAKKGWDRHSISALEDSSDRVLKEIGPPTADGFDKRGLVLGYVQSGKTANYTALIAKAADVGYRLVIVLAGIDNGLRLQTNLRLQTELVGMPPPTATSVPLPPLGKRWHEFTRATIDGDFRPGFANHASLQGSQPVLLVIKKNGAVLRRLLTWLDKCPIDIRSSIPTLLIDDEADQASVDTQGTYQLEGEPLPPDYEPPSVINQLIRQLLARFDRRAYVAYTATPFANILIPHDTHDPAVADDLYPRDFIVDLPKPDGYFGTEELFGRFDEATDSMVGGIDAIRKVPDSDLAEIQAGRLPASLSNALLDFVLAGAARAHRGRPSAPATMLIHTSQLVARQDVIFRQVQLAFAELRDEWRYNPKHTLLDRLRARWDDHFRPITRASHADRDVPFDQLLSQIGPFCNAVVVRKINSDAGEMLDYEREPSLKAIAVGGNRLSRGLTLEGLLVSYFLRSSPAYDTLLQMGRWFGFRRGYEDLMRIHTTTLLHQWFSDLAAVEHRLREDIRVYERLKVTPRDVGLRILMHPAMKITSLNKQRFARVTVESIDYSLCIEQSLRFRLDDLRECARAAEENRILARGLIGRLGEPDSALTDSSGPVWSNVAAGQIVGFLHGYQADPSPANLDVPQMAAYIEKCSAKGELNNWIVAVRGRKKADPILGTTDWGSPTGLINQISRTKLRGVNSIGALRDPEDESIGLATTATGKNARLLRPATQGLLLLYPISRHSGHELPVASPDSHNGATRESLFTQQTGALARDLVGIAVSFPRSNAQRVDRRFSAGTVSWRSY
jgi:hypothetical protein